MTVPDWLTVFLNLFNTFSIGSSSDTLTLMALSFVAASQRDCVATNACATHSAARSATIRSNIVSLSLLLFLEWCTRWWRVRVNSHTYHTGQIIKPKIPLNKQIIHNFSKYNVYVNGLQHLTEIIFQFSQFSHGVDRFDTGDHRLHARISTSHEKVEPFLLLYCAWYGDNTILTHRLNFA